MWREHDDEPLGDEGYWCPCCRRTYELHEPHACDERDEQLAQVEAPAAEDLHHGPDGSYSPAISVDLHGMHRVIRRFLTGTPVQVRASATATGRGREAA